MNIAIIGLGYVGLPLAGAFCCKHKVIGYDIDTERVAMLNQGIDITNEGNPNNLKACIASGRLTITHNAALMATCTVFIITVPTPLTQFKTPDLSYLLAASTQVGALLKKGDTVIYESTVYPGCTEEVCIPELEAASGLVYNKDFTCGYSPERISPGDRVHTLENIKKITSGSNAQAAEFVDGLYRDIITAGTYKAPTIKVAEAAKAVENAQRDINISFINELALICDKLEIDTNDVIEAAATKWNFMPYKPGLVGGHCIGVDPYYLVHKAESVGYYPQVILSGRRVNDNMGVFVANKLIKLLIAHRASVKDSRVLILGFAFKENCPDIRNTRVADIYHELLQFGLQVDVYDPVASPTLIEREYGIVPVASPEFSKYHAMVIAVAHTTITGLDYSTYFNNGTIIFDTKACIARQYTHARL